MAWLRTSESRAQLMDASAYCVLEVRYVNHAIAFFFAVFGSEKVHFPVKTVS